MMGKTFDQIDKNKLKAAAMVIRAVNHDLRQSLLHFISKQEPVMVSNIYKKLGLEQSVTSQHLAILRKEGFVTTKREGKKILYSVNYDRLEEVMEIAKRLDQG